MILVILTALTSVAMVFSFFTFFLTMTSFRLYEALKNKLSGKEILIVTLTPFSIGYYLILKERANHKMYHGLMIFYFALTLFGIMFTMYQFLI